MKTVHAQRRDAVRALARARGLDALLVSRDVNRFYLSGFELHDAQMNESSGRLVITGDGRDWLATDSRFAEAATRQWDPERVFVYKDEARDVAALLKRCGSRIGFEARGVSFAWARDLGKQGGLFLEAADGLTEKARMRKGQEEIGALQASFALNHAMLEWLGQSLSEGRFGEDAKEVQLAWGIERFFRENGASELAFPVIAARGPNAALPHAIPGDERLGRDCPLLVDAGCRVNAYCSDQTRTWWLGEKSGPEHARFSRVHELVSSAQRAALDMMRPGVTGKDAYLAARAVFEKAGEAGAFTHGLGHGVGLETHEAPSLNSRSETPLEPGMVVTVEPGLYYPGWGGVRLEYTVLVEEDGVRVL
ncbi:MAG: aminopeptidase P family protein [Desulfovibrio sp.]|nr:aminopeptidase P family protein [Desulfovibrio sp.]